jgi:transposase
MHQRLPAAMREITLKAQAGLAARYRTLSGGGKRLTATITAIARELVGFVWAIG